LKHLPGIILMLALLTVFGLPLIFWRGFLFPSTFAKTVFFITTVEIMFVFWLPSALERIKQRGKGLLMNAVLLFFGVSLVASFLGVDFYQSVWSNDERMMGLWTIGHIVLFFIILATTFTQEYHWRWIFGIATVSALIVSMIGISEFLKTGTASRIESTLFNSAFLASYLLLASFITFWLLLREERFKSVSIFWVFSLALLFFALMLTGTRGAAIAYGCGMLFLSVLFLLFGPREGCTLSLRHTTLKKIVGGIVILFFMLVGSGFIVRDQLIASSFDPISRLASISFSGSTIEGRLLAWSVAWEGWKERPFLGWGVENYNLLFNKHYDPRLIDQEPWFDRAHNIIFDVGSTTGFVGLFTYLGIFFSGMFILFRAWKRRELPFWTFAVFFVALTVHLIQNLFVFDAITSLVLLFTILAFIHSRAIIVPFSIKHAPTARTVVMLLGVLVVLPLLYVGAWKPLRENRLGKFGYDALASGRDEEAFHYIDRALAYNTYGDVDVRRGVAEYVFEFLKQGGERNQESLKRVIDYAVLKMEENIAEKPKDVKWYMYQGALYNLGAVLLDSPQYAERAEELFVKSKMLSYGRIQIYLEIAQARKVLGDYKGMWNALDEAMLLLPNNPLLHINAGVHAIEVGDQQRETAELEWLFANHPFFNKEIFRDTYYEVGRIEKAIDFHILRIKETLSGADPSRRDKTVARQYAALADLYKRAGLYDNARQAAASAVTYDPSQKSAAEMFINTLPE